MKIKLAAFLLFIHFNSFGQLNTLGSRFFFNLPMHGTKFETRTVLHGNANFSKVGEHTDVMFADFSSHELIKNISSEAKAPEITVWFDTDGGSIRKRITISYTVNQVNNCIKEYENLISYFKPYTSRTEDRESQNVGGEQTGKGIRIYPTTGADFKFIDFYYSYSSAGDDKYKWERYDLEILMFE